MSSNAIMRCSTCEHYRPKIKINGGSPCKWLGKVRTPDQWCAEYGPTPMLRANNARANAGKMQAETARMKATSNLFPHRLTLEDRR